MLPSCSFSTYHPMACIRDNSVPIVWKVTEFRARVHCHLFEPVRGDSVVHRVSATAYMLIDYNQKTTLQRDGSGVLSFTTPETGTPNTVTVATAQITIRTLLSASSAMEALRLNRCIFGMALGPRRASRRTSSPLCEPTLRVTIERVRLSRARSSPRSSFSRTSPFWMITPLGTLAATLPLVSSR